MWRRIREVKIEVGKEKEPYMTYIITQAIVTTLHVILREEGVVVSELDFMKINPALLPWILYNVLQKTRVNIGTLIILGSYYKLL